MAKNRFVSEVINTPEGVVAWPVVFEGEEKTGEDGKKRTVYRADLILSGDADIAPLQDLLYAACVAEYGPDEAQWPHFRRKAVRETTEKNPNPQTGKPWEGYEAGKYFISLQSQFRPSIIDQSGREIIDPQEFYGGCKAIFAVNAYTYNYKGHGVKLGLVAILKTGEGKPFGSARPDANQIFKRLIKPGATPDGRVAAPAGAEPQQRRRAL
jgi:hypothetical protein